MEMEIETIKKRYEYFAQILDERMLRLWAGTESCIIGRGGVAAVTKATGLSRNTIVRGIKEMKDKDKTSSESVRKTGGGRKRIIEKNPELKRDLDTLMEPVTRGDPESPLLWTCKSLRKLSC